MEMKGALRGLKPLRQPQPDLYMARPLIQQKLYALKGENLHHYPLYLNLIW
jgi:hypothetical protein